MKFVLYAMLSLVALAILAVVVLTQFVNPNQFKPLIVQQVEKATGQTLVINGDIHWRFFPSLGLTVGNTALLNPVGFEQPNLLSFEKAELSVEVMPLFSHRLVLGQIQVDQPTVDIETNALGQSNVAFLNDENTATAQGENTSVSSTPNAAPMAQTASKIPWQVSIGGIALNQAKVSIENAQTQQSTQLSKVDLKLSQWVEGQWSDLSFGVQGTHQDTQFLIEGQGKIKAAADLSDLLAKDITLTANASGKNWQIRRATVNATQWALGHWTDLTYQVDGLINHDSLALTGGGQMQWNAENHLALVKNFTLEGHLSGANLPNGLPLKAELTGRYNTKEALLALQSLSLTAQDTNFSGQVTAHLNQTPAQVSVNLTSPSLNVDQWQAWLKAFDGQSAQVTTTENNATAAPMSANTEETGVTTLSNQEPDLSALKDLDLQAKWQVGQLIIANAHLSQVALNAQVQKGVLTLQSLKANLYQGAMQFAGQLNASTATPTYQVEGTVSQVNMAALLSQVAQKKWLSGTANAQVNVSGQGLSPLALRQNSQGSAKVTLADGQVFGVNLSQMIREGKAALKGQTVSDDNAEKATDFSQANVALAWQNGVASTQSLSLDSPLVALSGQAQSDLVEQTLNGNFNVTLTQKAAQADADLNGLTVPVILGGNWQDPTWRIDVQSLLLNNNSLKEKAEREINKGIDKLFGDNPKNDKLKDAANQLLKGLFH